MGRSKAFNEELVLDKAIEVFWAKGYEATSIQDLVDAMGIQRGSLYGTFGSKQELFLKSLDRYSLVVVKDLLGLLTSKTSALESIELFFDKLVEHLLTAGPLRGCLITNSAVEFGLRDERTRQKVLYLLNGLEQGFYQTLLSAQESGEISKEHNLTALAEYLTNSMQGLLVMGKVHSERSVLENINRITLSVLK
ncbi:MAG: TetR/AcrR family transcriptional regulator [Methylococcales bacterium]|nr:TetR/AcrR family transcriptional regulator [Methylococcales bacterium]MDP7562294.1 TetR family transcriptional regulator [Methylococcales bacterium]